MASLIQEFANHGAKTYERKETREEEQFSNIQGAIWARNYIKDLLWNHRIFFDPGHLCADYFAV